MKFLCEQCKAKYQIADDKAAGKTVRMKCRKCGHLIEVRAGVADSRSSAPPPATEGAAPTRPGTTPKAPARPAAPRAGGLATSLASAKPATKTGDRTSSALAGAFRSSVQREEETSAPFDMSDLSPGDEWYVAINGVPVGPIRVTEVRRKAALGAVTEESLCWQEGLDEWRPVRSFPELAAIVRDALASGRASLPPAPGQERGSVPPPRVAGGARPSSAPAAMSPRPPAARPVATPPPAAARSNVVPIHARVATAEKLDDIPDDRTKPFTGALLDAAVVADPFASPPVASPAPAPAAMAVPAATQHLGALSEASAASIAAPPPRRAPPWMAIAMVGAACAFGVTAALAIFLRPQPAPTPVVVQVPVPAAAAPTGGPAATATGTTADPVSADPSASSAPRGPIAMGGGSRPAPGAATTAAPSKGPLDLGGLGGGSIRPTDDTSGGDAPKAPGQCFSSGQVSQVIGLHQPGIRRSCWERNPTTKPTVNVSVSLTIGADGSPGGVSASAEEPSVAKCVENDVRTWRFPAMGCSQATSFSLKFVRQ